MGVDIHAVVEIKNEEGLWEVIPEIPEAFTWRNYFLFDVLRDICNEGLPEEVVGNKYRYNEEYNYWEVDYSEDVEDRYYGFGWLTLKEFQSHVFRHNPFFVSVAFYDKFIELGGKFPEAMLEVSEDGNRIAFSVLDDDEIEELDCLLSVEKDFSKVAEMYGLDDQPENIRVVFAFDC